MTNQTWLIFFKQELERIDFTKSQTHYEHFIKSEKMDISQDHESLIQKFGDPTKHARIFAQTNFHSIQVEHAPSVPSLSGSQSKIIAIFLGLPFIFCGWMVFLSYVFFFTFVYPFVFLFILPFGYLSGSLWAGLFFSTLGFIGLGVLLFMTVYIATKYTFNALFNSAQVANEQIS